MKQFVRVIFLALFCGMLVFANATAAIKTREISTQPAVDVGNSIGSGFSYGVQILNHKGKLLSTLKSGQLRNGVILAFTNLTDKPLKIKFLMLSNGQPQKFSVAQGEEAYEFAYEIDAASTVNFPVSAAPENGYPSSDSEFLFLLNTDCVPMGENDDVCFYTFSHPFRIEGDVNASLRQPIESAAREMTAEELDESGDSFYSAAAFVSGQQTTPEKLLRLTGEADCRIRVRSSGPAGVYARLLFINDCLVFQNGKACELFSLEENQTFEREYDLKYLFEDTTVYSVTVEVGAEGWRSSDTSKLRILFQ